MSSTPRYLYQSGSLCSCPSLVTQLLHLPNGFRTRLGYMSGILSSRGIGWIEPREVMDICEIAWLAQAVLGRPMMKSLEHCSTFCNPIREGVEDRVSALVLSCHILSILTIRSGSSPSNVELSQPLHRGRDTSSVVEDSGQIRAQAAGDSGLPSC